MRFCIQGIETGTLAHTRYFQLILTDDAITGLLLSGCSPKLWRARLAQASRGGVDPQAAITRLVERYQRLGVPAVVGESTANFVVRWDEVHEVQIGTAECPEIVFRLVARTWLGLRRRRTFRLEPLDGRDVGSLLVDVEAELYGQVKTRRG